MLDFPSGRALLVSPDGVVHARDGDRTMRSFRAIQLWLGDGTRVTATPAPGGRDPLRSVEVDTGDRELVLWRAGHRIRHRGGERAPPNRS